MSTKVNREIREKVGQSAKRGLAVHGQGGKGELQRQPDICQVRPSQKVDFLPARVCGRWRAGPLLALQTAALLPSCAEELKDSCCKYEGS